MSQLLAKRIFDIAIAVVVSLVVMPMLLVVAVLVRCSSPGPVLFRQMRIGKDGQTFLMYKFRTMFADNNPMIHHDYYRSLVDRSAKPIGGVFKLSNDPRITPVGRILRRFSLDELPQLFNVLKGDMSLVGPRPPQPYEVAMYDERARLRLSVTPGITGLWQVSGRNELDFHEMVDLDLTYIARWSFWLDLLIILRTPLVLITAKGAR
jgi:exopolysaccharide biosynthesis polyprenyl glycosylphosphotransferase